MVLWDHLDEQKWLEQSLSQVWVQPQCQDRHCHPWPRVLQLSERLYQGCGHLHNHLEVFQDLKMILSGAGALNVYKEMDVKSCLLCKCKPPKSQLGPYQMVFRISYL